MWPCYRLVLTGHVSLLELEQLSINDVDLMLDAVHAWDEAQHEANKTK